DSGQLVARAVAPAGSALAAELAGSRVSPDELALGIVPAVTARAAERVRAAGVLVAAARSNGRIVGSVELLRATGEFDEREHALAELVAAQLGLASRSFATAHGADGDGRARTLELAGEALAAGPDVRRAARQAARVAAEATGARGAALWRAGGERGIELLALHGPAEASLDRAAELAHAALATWRPLAVDEDPGLPDGALFAASIRLGE